MSCHAVTCCAEKPLYIMLVEYQQRVMEDDWCIQSDFGCQYLSQLMQIYPSDSLM